MKGKIYFISRRQLNYSVSGNQITFDQQREQAHGWVVLFSFVPRGVSLSLLFHDEQIFYL